MRASLNGSADTRNCNNNPPRAMDQGPGRYRIKEKDGLIYLSYGFVFA